ncbi:DNA repair and recombination protein RAD54B-like [Diadema setosum]|uniref:DNA repair and recombination protein RAD54B-like n=1 Tax=Diadema setosum TaxID=31175 RepID=UPI003B3BDD4F
MRRSAAPSQQGLACKRPRFNPPFRANSASGVANHPFNSFSKHCAHGEVQNISDVCDSSTKILKKKMTGVGDIDCNSSVEEKAELCDKLEECQSTPASNNRRTHTEVTSYPHPNHTIDVEEAESQKNGDVLGPNSQCEVPSGETVDGGCQSNANSGLNQLASNRLHKRPFKVKQAVCLQAAKPAQAADGDRDVEPKRHFYSVMWCKMSKKKHKKWEGDAILVTKGRTVTLLDTEGKEIGKGSGYRPSELESMVEGHTLCIGGKEIEVMSAISENDWTTGKCFQTGSSSSPSSSLSSRSGSLHRSKPNVVKPFANPQRAGLKSDKCQTFKPRIVKPLFDPALPGCLVMPRPPSSHQWQHNERDDTVVDVVVDPHLTAQLRPHQREGVLFLYECIMGLRQFQGNGAILADEMGLGKTLQCITLIWTLFKQGPYGGKPVIKRVLIVTPGSLVKNWCREFRKWLGSERISVFPVSSEKKVEEFKKSPLFPVMVISYEMLVRYAEDVRQITFDLIVCDEGHRLKNSTIKTTSLLSSLAVRRRILLTGTPIQNDLQEFYSIVEFCNPGVFGTSASFHRVYEDPILRGNQPQATQEEKKLGQARASELSRLTSLFVLRRTQEVNNRYLPPKVEMVIFCRPSPLQLLLYRQLLGSRLVRSCFLRGYSISSGAGSPHLVCIGALKKLCNDPSLLYAASREVDGELKEKEGDPRGWLLDDSEEEVSLYDGLFPLYPEDYREGKPLVEHCGKLWTLSRMLGALHADPASRERIVIVSNYTQTLDLLQALCTMEGYQFSRLDGSTPTAKRQSIVEHFNSSYAKETVFLLSSKAGGVGLNLIGASRLLLYDIDWNPANDLQAMARVWRDGQKKTVHIYRMITAGTIEEKIYQRQISKQSLSGAVVDTKDAASSVKFSLEDLKDLFTLHEDCACITHEMLGCDCQENTSEGEQCEQAPVPKEPIRRACQLGRQQSASIKKNLSMGELNDWRHYPAPLQDDFEDEFLLAAKERITFVFQSETNMNTFQTAPS